MLSKHCFPAKGCAVSQQNVVPGDGPVPAKVMFVGQSPTPTAQAKGRPFPPFEATDDAGGILNSWLDYLGLDRSEVYVTNVVKCPRQQLNSPSDEQFSACARWLSDELRLVTPKLLVLLGGVAQKRFTSRELPGDEDSFLRVWDRYPGRGHCKEHRGITYFTLDHPSSAAAGGRIDSNTPSWFLARLDQLRRLLAEWC